MRFTNFSSLFWG